MPFFYGADIRYPAVVDEPLNYYARHNTSSKG
jgi:hypothetical protein